MIYKHKQTGQYLRMVKKRPSGVNSYIIVDKEDNPILKAARYAAHNRQIEQRRIVKGFDKLEKHG